MVGQTGQGQDSIFESAQYQANNFAAQEQLEDAPGGLSGFLGISGALAFFRQGVFFTRPLQNSYGLVQVSGPSGLPISVDSVVQGTTNSRGDVVVPNLIPYVDNRIEVGGLGTLPEYQIDAPDKVVVPRYQSGTEADFELRKIQLFIGTLSVRRGAERFPPKYGLFQIVGPSGTLVSDIGENGEFFFESLKPGAYRGTITFSGGAPCSFDLVVPISKEFQVDLGPHTCVER